MRSLDEAIRVTSCSRPYSGSFKQMYYSRIVDLWLSPFSTNTRVRLERSCRCPGLSNGSTYLSDTGSLAMQ